MIELMLVMGIMAAVSGMAIVQIGAARSAAKGDAPMRIVVAQMNQAREMATPNGATCA